MSLPQQQPNRHGGGRKSSKQHASGSPHNPQGRRTDQPSKNSSGDSTGYPNFQNVEAIPTLSAAEFIEQTNKYELTSDIQSLDPHALMRSVKSLDENKQMNDLRELAIYNGLKKREALRAWHHWEEHRGMTPEYERYVIHYQDLQLYPKFHISGHIDMRRALATYMDVRAKALEAGLDLLAVEASKKVLDYILLCECSTKRDHLFDVSEMVKKSDIWTSALETIAEKDPSRRTEPTAAPASAPAPPPPQTPAPAPAPPPPQTPASAPAPPLLQIPVPHPSLMATVSRPTPSTTMSSACRNASGTFMAPVHADGGNASGSAETTELVRSIEALLLQPDERVPSWDEIILPRNLKDNIRDTVDGYRIFPSISQTYHGMLLHGVWGTGKTVTIKAVARAADFPLYMVDTASLLSKWQGESQKFIKAVFDQAVERQPSIIYFDDIDGVCSTQGESDQQSTTMQQIRQLMQTMWSTLKENGHKVLVVGSTNRPDKVDKAFLRRFNKLFHVQLPDARLRSQLLRAALSKVKHALTDKEIERLGKLMGALTGDNIFNCVGILEGDRRMECYRSQHWIENHDGIRVPNAGETPTIRDRSYQDFTSEQRKRIVARPLIYVDVKEALECQTTIHEDEDINFHERWSERFGTRVWLGKGKGLDLE